MSLSDVCSRTASGLNEMKGFKVLENLDGGQVRNSEPIANGLDAQKSVSDFPTLGRNFMFEGFYGFLVFVHAESISKMQPKFYIKHLSLE